MNRKLVEKSDGIGIMQYKYRTLTERHRVLYNDGTKTEEDKFCCFARFTYIKAVVGFVVTWIPCRLQ